MTKPVFSANIAWGKAPPRSPLREHITSSWPVSDSAVAESNNSLPLMNHQTSVCNYDQIQSWFVFLLHRKNSSVLIHKIGLTLAVIICNWGSQINVAFLNYGLNPDGDIRAVSGSVSSTVWLKHSSPLPLSKLPLPNFLNAFKTLTCGRFPAVSHTSP